MDTHGPPLTALLPSGLVGPAAPSLSASPATPVAKAPRVVYAIGVTPFDAGKTLKAGAKSSNGQQLFVVVGQFEVSASLRFNEVLQRIETLTHLNLDDYDVVYRKRLYGHPWNSSLPIESQRAHDAFVAEALRVKADAPIMVRLLRRHHGHHSHDHDYAPYTPQQKQQQQPSARSSQLPHTSSSNSSKKTTQDKASKQHAHTASPTGPSSSVELVVLIRIVRGREVQGLTSTGFIGPRDDRHLQSGGVRATRPIFETTAAAAADKVTRFSIKASHSFDTLREQMTAEIRRLLADRQVKLSDFEVTYGPSEGFNNFDRSIFIESSTKYRSFVDEVLKKSRWGRPLIEVQLRWKGTEWVSTPSSFSPARASRSERYKWGMSSSKHKGKSNPDSAPRAHPSPMLPTGDQTSNQRLSSSPSTPRIQPSLSKKRGANGDTSECHDSMFDKRRRRSTTSPCAARESSTTGSSPLEEGEHFEVGNIGADGLVLPDGPYITISEFMQTHRPGYDELVEKLHKQGIRDMPHLAACHTSGLLKGQEQKRKCEYALSLIDCVCIATWLRLWREMEPKAKKEAQDF